MTARNDSENGTDDPNVQRAFIRCLGCNVAVIPASTAVCPGCGRCVGCGKLRASGQKTCPRCELPHCSCCGRCPDCNDMRYTVDEPCECGHPHDEANLIALVRSAGVTRTSKPGGCFATAAFLAAGFLALSVCTACLF